MTVATIPAIFYEFAFNADPNQNTLPPYWSDLSGRALFGWHTTRGKQYELDVNEVGEWTVALDNRDGALDPGNQASPYWPNVLPFRGARVRTVLGNNLLTPDQASGGEWSPLAPGAVPVTASVASLSGYAVSVVAAGAGAYQGTQVFAVTVPSGATAPRDVLDVAVPQVTAGQAYTFSVQTQVTTSGQSPTANAAVNWLNAAGQVVSTASGTGTVLTGASGVWTQLAVSGTAATGAVAAVLRLVVTTTLSANATFWADGLQLEARGYATRWQMPWTTGVNMLPQTVATGLETMNPVTDAATNWFYPTGTATVAQALNLTAAPTGATTAAAWTIPSGVTAGTALLYAGVAPSGAPAGPAADCAQVTAGTSYTASAYLSRTSTADAIQVSVSIAWFNVAGTALPLSAGTAVAVSSGSWTRATVTGTAPAGAAWGRALLTVTSPTTTVQNTVYAAGWQLEQAGAASAWADPGVTAFPFAGFVERWPRTWNELNGTFGTSRPVCVDALAALAQFTLQAPFVNEVLALGPDFFYQLNDPTSSTSCADTAGKRIAAPVENAPAGAGSLTFGNTITSTNPGSAFVGTPGPIATFANSAAGFGQNVQNPQTYISIHKTTVTPGPPPNGNWTRVVHFRASGVPTGVSPSYTLWLCLPSSAQLATNASFFRINILPSGQAWMTVTGTTGGTSNYQNLGPNLCDGNWHQLAVAVDGSGNVTMYVDGAAVVPTGTAIGLPMNGFASDDLGSMIQLGANFSQAGLTGDLACAVELPFAATAAQITNLYNSWRSASSGESTGSRYQRVLTWCGWTGPAQIDSGLTQSMGPATDLTGTSGLDALNNIALTENGDQYASSAGVMTFKSRGAYYNSRIPTFVFGEGPPVGNFGEWPCELGTIDYDPSRLANLVQVQQYGGLLQQGNDAVSRRRFFPRRYQRTVNTASAPEAASAATYLLGQLKDPRQRADVIRLHPSAIPGLFAVCARLEKGVRIRLIVRPVTSPPTTLDLFVQKIDWTWDPDTNDVWVDLQASPADLNNYGVLAAMHTTLSAQATSGTNTATINALPDAAYNMLSQSLPSGYSLTFEPGTPRAETLALAAGGIPATVLGYATATLTFATNLAFTHAAGTVVCEPLPAGYTDPTAWDASAIIGAAYTTVLSGGASGTNTVTVGPLPDAAYNALGQTWNTGDQITLSPGTPNAETVTIASVATTYPGYASCQITLTANLAHSHAAGDWATDPLPAGVNSPTALAPTFRLAY